MPFREFVKKKQKSSIKSSDNNIHKAAQNALVESGPFKEYRAINHKTFLIL